MGHGSRSTCLLLLLCSETILFAREKTSIVSRMVTFFRTERNVNKTKVLKVLGMRLHVTFKIYISLYILYTVFYQNVGKEKRTTCTLFTTRRGDPHVRLVFFFRKIKSARAFANVITYQRVPFFFWRKFKC